VPHLVARGPLGSGSLRSTTCKSPTITSLWAPIRTARHTAHQTSKQRQIQRSTERAPSCLESKKPRKIQGFLRILQHSPRLATTPKGTRTPVFWLRTRHPRPLDDGGGLGIVADCRLHCQANRRSPRCRMPRARVGLSATVRESRSFVSRFIPISPPAFRPFESGVRRW
jgi:hypothetical protein